MEAVAIPSISGLRVTPCDFKKERQAGENAAPASGFVTSGRWQSPGVCSAKWVAFGVRALRGCVWRQNLGLGEGLGRHKMSRASVT